jgi:hypothetical protein
VNAESTSTNIGYGSGKRNSTVVSSTFAIVPGLPLIVISGVPTGTISLFWYISSNQNIQSFAVNGCPSDHFIPLRSERRIVFPPSTSSQDLATAGTSL